MGTRAALSAAAAAMLAACAARGGAGRTGVRADVLGAPRAVPLAAGASLAVWELHLRNDGERPVRLESLTRRRSDRAGDETFAGLDLARRVVPRRREPELSRRADLPPGERAVVLLEAAVAADGAPAFECDVVVAAPGERGATWRETVTAPAAAADVSPPVVLSPPLAGPAWSFENGPETLSGHRRAVVWLSRRPRAAQRFAGDFFRVDAAGAPRSGDPRRNESYHAFGAEVLAVADAVVAAAVDGIPDNVPDPTERAVGMSGETVAGNHVVLDLGAGRFAMYAHLREGSVAVRAGDAVRRGQVLGALGNSGNSTEPHLHFHVADGPSPVDASGLPFVFDAFASGGRQFAGALPGEGSVVDFGRPSQATTGAPSASATK